MSLTLDTLKITEHGTYRARLIELGDAAPSSRHIRDGDEPIVAVTLQMPLSDARRFGSMMYEWMELKASTASLDRIGERE